MVLIYTTASPGKPSYRRGILDALCYPDGHIIRYSYRRQHIEPPLLVDTKLLHGQDAVIIFVDLDAKSQVTYFPLRRVKIRNVTPVAGQVSPPLARERVNFSLLFQDFVEYTDSHDEKQWHERVQKFDPTREITGAKPRYFVIRGNDDFPGSRNSVPAAWEDLVTAVSKSTGLRDAIFVRLDHIKRNDSGQERFQEYAGDKLVYRLRPGQIYRLDLCVFEKLDSTRSHGEEAKLKVSTSATDLLEVDQPFQSIVSGLAEKSALVSCKRTIEDTISTISVRVIDKGPSTTAVNSPSPILFVHISVSRKVLGWFVVLVFLGGLAVSIGPELIKELHWTCRPALWALLTKIVGAICLAIAAFLAFRKLPSGQG